jgi:UDP-glucose:(heptosyl)LPS alpha-1,3-glucosyltransferase
MRPLRIGLVIDRLDPSRGGAEAYLVGLARFLVDRGHAVHHLVVETGPGVSVGEVHRIDLPTRWRTFRDLAFDRASARLAADLGLDVTLGVRHTPSTRVFQPHGGVYSCAARAQSRSAGSRRGVHALARMLNPKHRVLLHLETRQRRRRHQVTFVALSERVRSDMTEAYRLSGLAPPALIYNGVDAGRFHPEAAGTDRATIRERHGIDPGGFCVLFVGHNFRLKGLGHLIPAVAGLDDRTVSVLVVGRGRDGPYRKLADSCGLTATRLRFAGATETPERYYRAADVLAHPTYYDPCSSVCLEALASGLPVITTRMNGVNELIGLEGGGRVIERPGDVDALRATIQEIREDDSYRERLAGEARRLAEAHPEHRAFAAMEAVLLEAAERRR